jgi:hypothetical protein
MDDFDTNTIVPMRKQQFINGFGKSTTEITHTGTILWNILDDNGSMQTIKIPNSLLVPEGGVRLLSPQHWAQEYKLMHPTMNDDIVCITNHSQIQLSWNNNNLTKIIKLDNNQSNTAIMWTIPGNTNYVTFHSELNDQGIPKMCFCIQNRRHNQ